MVARCRRAGGRRQPSAIGAGISVGVKGWLRSDIASCCRTGKRGRLWSQKACWSELLTGERLETVALFPEAHWMNAGKILSAVICRVLTSLS
jgi:hypothetical protein